MDKRLLELEGEEITKSYDQTYETYGNPEDRIEEIELAEEMLEASATCEMEDKW